jgi:hypothetical protein
MARTSNDQETGHPPVVDREGPILFGGTAPGKICSILG